MRLSQYWCMSKPFVRLILDWYSWWDSWIMTGIWTPPPLWDLIVSETWPPVGLQLIVDIPTVSKVRYPDLVVSTLRATLAVTPSVSYPKFLPPTSGTCLTYTSQTTLAATISGAWPTLPWRCGWSMNWREAKGDKKVEIKLEDLVGLSVFVVYNLLSSHVI